MALVLAIDPAFTQHDALQRLADDLAAHEIVFASSCDEALAIIGRQIPDLIVFPIFCAEADSARIIARVCALSGVDDPRTLAIPLQASTAAETSANEARWFYWFKPRGETTGTEARDARAFAALIRDYLATEPEDLATERGDPSTGQSGEQSAARGNSLPGRMATATAAARAILARLSALRPLRHARMSPPGGRRLAGTAPLLAARVRAAGQAILAPLPELRFERPVVSQRRSQPRWRRAFGAALLLVLAVTTAAGLTRRVEWFTAKPARATSAGRQPPTPRAGMPAGGKKTDPARKTGSLSVTSNPDGATVAVDGRTRGVTPLVVDDLGAGRHAVTLERAGGTVERSVEVKADQTSTLEVPIYSGWLALFAPIELEIQADGRVLRFDERHQALLPPGRHQIVVLSRELGYRDSRVVDVKPGEVTRLSIEPPKTTLTVTAAAPAQVWLDGTHIGAAPLIDVPIDLGTHQLVVRHPTAGEERRTIAATSAPVRVEITFGNQD